MPKQRVKSLPEEQAAQKERMTQSKKERTNSRHTGQVEGSGRWKVQEEGKVEPRLSRKSRSV